METANDALDCATRGSPETTVEIAKVEAITIIQEEVVVTGPAVADLRTDIRPGPGEYWSDRYIGCWRHSTSGQIGSHCAARHEHQWWGTMDNHNLDLSGGLSLIQHSLREGRAARRALIWPKRE